MNDTLLECTSRVLFGLTLAVVALVPHFTWKFHLRCGSYVLRFRSERKRFLVGSFVITELVQYRWSFSHASQGSSRDASFIQLQNGQRFVPALTRSLPTCSLTGPIVVKHGSLIREKLRSWMAAGTGGITITGLNNLLFEGLTFQNT